MSFVAAGIGGATLGAGMLGTGGALGLGTIGAAGLGAGAAGTLGAGALGAGAAGAGALGAGAAGAGLGAGALGAGGGLLSAAAPAATGGTFGSILSGATPMVGSGLGSAASGLGGTVPSFGAQAASQGALNSIVNPAANAIGNGTSALINPTALLGGTPGNMMSGMTPATPGMFDGLGGALETGLENLNKVAQPAANISQAVAPFMSEEQGIQASPITPPTYSNNLNELVAQNEQTDQQRIQEEMMRRMEQRKKIQDLALGGAA